MFQAFFIIFFERIYSDENIFVARIIKVDFATYRKKLSPNWPLKEKKKKIYQDIMGDFTRSKNIHIIVKFLAIRFILPRNGKQLS